MYVGKEALQGFGPVAQSVKGGAAGRLSAPRRPQLLSVAESRDLSKPPGGDGRPTGPPDFYTLNAIDCAGIATGFPRWICAAARHAAVATTATTRRYRRREPSIRIVPT